MVWPLAALGQKPVASTVVNAASYSQSFTSTVGHNIAGGSIATVFGTNLAASTQTANSTPLPFSLGGTSVSVNGVAAPLFYVSPTQINFQAPSPPMSGGADDPPGASSAHGIVVVTAAGSSAVYTGQGTDSAMGIFTVDGSGCGRGDVLNVNPDGAVSLNSPANSVSPGSYLTVYSTGLGLVYGGPPDGSPAPSSPLMTASSGAAGVFDSVIDYTLERYNWDGRAPGMIGVDQVNVAVPAGTREGCAVPFQVLAGLYGFISQPVTISVRKGGGTCVDPPMAGYGLITWEKAVSTTAAGVATETDTVTASLLVAPGMQAPSLLPPAPVENSYRYFGASCPIPGYRSLGAGTVTVQGPGFGPVPAAASPLQQGQVSGLTMYQAALPAGTIQPGSLSVTASGGADVGAFQSSVQMPPEIRFTTALAGIGFPCNQGVTIRWTGGDPNAWVTVSQLFNPADAYSVQNYSQAVRVSDGALTVNMPPNGPPTCKNQPSWPLKLVVQVIPDPSEVAAFSAPGLSLGGRHLWRYTYTFDAFISYD